MLSIVVVRLILEILAESQEYKGELDENDQPFLHPYTRFQHTIPIIEPSQLQNIKCFGFDVYRVSASAGLPE